MLPQPVPTPESAPGFDDSPDPTSTGGLIALAKQGDSRAWNSLFGRFLPRLRRWASGRLPRWARDISDTTDLVHDAFLNTFRRLDRFQSRGHGALEAYLRRAVLNNVRMEHRRAAVRPTLENVDESTADTNGTTPLDRLIGEFEARRYAAALGRLSSADQEIIVARLRMKCTFDQLAMLLGKATPDAARVALNRALERLTTEMERD